MNIAEKIKKQTDNILRQRTINGTEGMIIRGIVSGGGSPSVTDLTTHRTSADHDGRYYTESEVDLIVSDLLSTLKNRGICFAISTVELATTQVIPLTVPFDMTIIGGKMTVETAPTDADLICDIHKNGTTLWSTQANRPKIVAGQFSGNITVPNVTALTKGDRLLFMIDQVGALVPGRDLSLTLYCEVV